MPGIPLRSVKPQSFMTSQGSPWRGGLDCPKALGGASEALRIDPAPFGAE